ncbi:MAG TPA: phosphoribosyltransferase family protein, partial [Pseudobdellovibrionaceae bacterium]
NSLVLGIPRGAMPMARIIAEGLDGELNAILIHKIPAPNQPELAIGSVGLSGDIYRLPLIETYEIPEFYVQQAAHQQLEILKKRSERFHLPPLVCKDRIVIIVDDGVATGATVFGAIHEIRQQAPRKLILAAGVVAKSTAEEIRPLVDELISLNEPEYFYAVSQFFEDFSQVTDEEVVEILKSAKKSKRQTEVNI